MAKPVEQTWEEFLATAVYCPRCPWKGAVDQTEAVCGELVRCPECGGPVEQQPGGFE